ncbi:unnamed protein product [Lupinus luteus]|uniref:Thioredoxin domain-containing protein n=1 Tax=Lupinus luteus TaxID=3873 RepID=A0AAV1W8C2_LUPLU
MMRIWGLKIVFAVLLCGSFSSSAESNTGTVSLSAVCRRESVFDFIIGVSDSTCSIPHSPPSFRYIRATEGNEVSLQKVLNMVERNNHEYVAVLFYASWCPFSQIFRPVFSILSFLNPSILHLAIEESSARPSTLSKYGVRGFPILFILNSTMCARYHGSRTLDSLVSFYSDVTGVRIDSLDQPSLQKIGRLLVREKHNHTELESFPFSWARSPENLLRQETYLALATAFVVLRLLYLFFPTLLICIQHTWRRVIRKVRLGSMLEHPLVYLKRIIQSFQCVKEPCKRSNLQEGAMNAKAWASKSLATVSIGEGSTNRGCTNK